MAQESAGRRFSINLPAFVALALYVLGVVVLLASIAQASLVGTVGGLSIMASGIIVLYGHAV